jgi:hypothetical protein
VVDLVAAHEAGIVALQVSSDGEVISDAVIFEYKDSPDTDKAGKGGAPVDDDDDDSASLVWECGNLCNSYLCETETCRRALRTTLLRRMEELESKLSDLDVGHDHKVKPGDNPIRELQLL